MRVFLLAVVLLVTAGCSPSLPSAMPDDFTATVEYETGSLPPRYRYEWRLTLTVTEATVSWKPGYDKSTPPWTTTVPVTREARATFYDRLRSSGGLQASSSNSDGMTGGSTGSVHATVDGETYDSAELGLSRDSRGLLETVEDAAKDLVPASVWADFDRKQDEWGKSQP
ncbi:hypothetical protein [Alloactinosynnema sp. L-07]|uniref:hypothetical protein n=1 Tax=Alloactinosynnema sp. L-07 TaxID=1653480 RepID=UPI00065EF255|nr:hypothetical protein [Alloactinosynnema sp. L-07]CRK56449.1 hypothetical protein [Alloactinosynnema sp. L-07]